MKAPLSPPIAPMLARLARTLPEGDYLYEPKWDGFRALAFRDAAEVDIRSRNNRPFARYFPEITDALRALPTSQFVVDGELLVFAEKRADFEALMLRLHPSAARVQRLVAETPATYVVFDLLARDDEDFRSRPMLERRRALETLLAHAPAQLQLTPASTDRVVAQEWLDHVDSPQGIDGVVAKPCSQHYHAGRRVMTKVKPERTADCVVAGYRWYADDPHEIGSLLLGLYDETHVLRHVGVVTSFARAQRRGLAEELAALEVPIGGHPWHHGFGLERSPVGRLKGAAGRWDPSVGPRDWTPLDPTLVAEVAFDTLEHRRFRHPARFRRWRPDRDPRTCTFEQLHVSA